jgi:hypothetical protein
VASTRTATPSSAISTTGFDRLRVRLQAQSLNLEQLRHRRGETRCPAADIASARLRTDLVVHRSGDSGSPREVGSTNDSNVVRTPGSVSASGLRPPPGRRVRPNGSSQASSSATPFDTVTALTPATRATTLIPPCLSARALDV